MEDNYSVNIDERCIENDYDEVDVPVVEEESETDILFE